MTDDPKDIWAYSKTIKNLVQDLLNAGYSLEVWCEMELVGDNEKCTDFNKIIEDIWQVEQCDLVAYEGEKEIGTAWLIDDGIEVEYVSNYTYSPTETNRPWDNILDGVGDGEQ